MQCTGGQLAMGSVLLMRSTPRPRRPAPELLTGHPWTVRVSSRAASDLVRHAMDVPLGDARGDAMSRVHEMLHVKLTPASDPHDVAKEHGVREMTLQCCEDARIHMFARRFMCGSHVAATLANVRRSRPRKSTLPVADAVLHWVATHGTGVRGGERPRKAFVPVFAGFTSSMRHTLWDLVDDLWLGACRFDATITAAKRLDALLALGEELEEQQRALAAMPRVAGSKLEMLDKSMLARQGRFAVSHNPDIRKCSGLTWSPCETRIYPMPERARGLRGMAFRGVRDVGTLPVRLDRYAVDGRVFRAWRPQPRGSLLVDCSGSMTGVTGTADMVCDVLALCPASHVALYGQTDSRPDRGGIAVVADAGRMATRDQLIAASKWVHQGGNEVDAQGLAWLVRQPKPRLWLSDGQFCVRGGASLEMARDVERLCEQGSVWRVETQEALEQAVVKLAARPWSS